MRITNSTRKNKQELQLVRLFSALGAADKNSLLSYAEFLSKNADEDDKLSPQKYTDPLVVSERPEKESVIKAIKRLTKSYPMIEKDKLLHSISDLMTAHMMQGKNAKLVIDELEAIFLKEYQNISK